MDSSNIIGCANGRFFAISNYYMISYWFCFIFKWEKKLMLWVNRVLINSQKLIKYKYKILTIGLIIKLLSKKDYVLF